MKTFTCFWFLLTAAGVIRASAPSMIFPCSWTGNIDKSKFNEPSGIVFHAPRGTLFVVGDEGDLCEIKTDGETIQQKRLFKAHTDFEGVAYDPATGLIYIVIEGDDAIIEVHPDSFEVLRKFPVERAFKGKTCIKPGGNGLEALTFVPDPKHSHGGTFFAANQVFRLDEPEDLSAVFEIEVPLREEKANAKAKIIRYFSPGAVDLSGLHYDGKTGHLFVISDATNTIHECSLSGETLHSWALPGCNQEGFTADNAGFLYIAQDSGGIIKMKRER